MIRPLRDLHRHAFIALAIALPLLVGAAVVLRDPPQKPHAPSPLSGRLVRSYPNLLPKYGVDVELRQVDQRSFLDFPRGDINEPDVLVYLVAPYQDLSAGLLLGSYRKGGALELPSDAPSKARLVLYSGARQEVLEEVVVELAR